MAPTHAWFAHLPLDAPAGREPLPAWVTDAVFAGGAMLVVTAFLLVLVRELTRS